MKRKHSGILLGAIMILSSLAFAFLSASRFSPQQTTSNKPQLKYAGKWDGIDLYSQQTALNKSIYYLQIYPNYQIMMRADPRIAEKIEGPTGTEIYSKIYSAKTVYVVFEPNQSNNVSLAYTELGRYLTSRPFELKFGVSEPYTDQYNRTFPYKDPFNTTSEEVVVFLRITNQTQIEEINNTLIVEAKNRWDLVDAAGKLELALIRLIQ